MTNELLSAEINALPERVRQWIHILETNADPAGDKWRLLAAEENIAGLTAEIERLRAIKEPRPELSADSPAGQYAAVLKEAEKGEEVNTMDLINALWWRLRNQRREIAKLHAQRKDTEHPPAAPQRGTLEPPVQATGEGADTEVSEKPDALNPTQSARLKTALDASGMTPLQWERFMISFTGMAEKSASEIFGPLLDQKLENRPDLTRNPAFKSGGQP